MNRTPSPPTTWFFFLVFIAIFFRVSFHKDNTSNNKELEKGGCICDIFLLCNIILFRDSLTELCRPKQFYKIVSITRTFAGRLNSLSSPLCFFTFFFLFIYYFMLLDPLLPQRWIKKNSFHFNKPPFFL